jgi:hypothetical protein
MTSRNQVALYDVPESTQTIEFPNEIKPRGFPRNERTHNVPDSSTTSHFDPKHTQQNCASLLLVAILLFADAVIQREGIQLHKDS